jgi:hypothetical protein
MSRDRRASRSPSASRPCLSSIRATAIRLSVHGNTRAVGEQGPRRLRAFTRRQQQERRREPLSCDPARG